MNPRLPYLKLLLALLVVSVFLGILYMKTSPLWKFKMDDGGIYRSNLNEVHRPTKTNAKHKQTKLIILGYKHGGSSITGATVESHPDVFFLYEPVWYMNDPDMVGFSITEKSLTLRERVKNKWKDMEDVPEPLDFVRSVLKCESLNLVPVLAKYWKYSGKVAMDMRSCVNKDTNKFQNDSCLMDVKNRCLRSRVTAIKTVRMSMKEVVKLMAEDKQVKLLYVVRDPRGNLNSRSRNNWGNKTTPEDINRELDTIVEGRNPRPLSPTGLFRLQCQIMVDDIQMLRQISPEYLDRILTIGYEDLARDPFKMATKIFNFLDLELTSETSGKLKEMFGSDVEGVSSTIKKVSRDDPFWTAIKWRLDIPFYVAQQLEKECPLVFETMGYRIFQTAEEMRDLKIPLRGRVTTPTFVAP